MKERFTAREVGVLVEELRSEFRVVSEVVLPLREDMAEVKDRLSAVESRLTSLEDVVRLSIPDHNRRITRLETKAGI